MADKIYPNFVVEPTKLDPRQFVQAGPSPAYTSQLSKDFSERDHLISHSRGIEGVIQIAMRIIRGEGTDTDAITVAKTFLELEDPDGFKSYIAAQDRKISVEEVFKNTSREIMRCSAGSYLDLVGWCGSAAGYKIWDHPIHKPDTDWLGTLPSGAVIANAFQGHAVPTILWTSDDRHPDRHIDVLLSPEEDDGGFKMTVRLIQHYQLMAFRDPETGKDFHGLQHNPGGRATESVGGDRGALVRALFYAGVIPERRADLAVQNASEEIDREFLVNAGFTFSVEYSYKYGWKPDESSADSNGATHIQVVQTYDRHTNTRSKKTVEVTCFRHAVGPPHLTWTVRGGNLPTIAALAKKRDVIEAIAGNDPNIPNLTPADFKRTRL